MPLPPPIPKTENTRTNCLRTVRVSILLLVLGTVPVLLWMVHTRGAQLGIVGYLVERNFPGITSPESYREAILHPERDDAYSAYSILAKRGSEIAHEIALRDLKSEDPYLWFNAALYLGKLDDRSCIPYLIKGLRHTASKTDPETAQTLTSLTGKDFGTDFKKWQNWWLSEHPDFQLDWESYLGHAGRIQKTTTPSTIIK